MEGFEELKIPVHFRVNGRYGEEEGYVHVELRGSIAWAVSTFTMDDEAKKTRPLWRQELYDKIK